MQIPVSDKVLAVAPMMAWTDRHCRFLHRLYAPRALLFTEMVSTGALLHGGRWQQLDYNPEEHPVALQLGGNDPRALALCSAEAARRGYDEINLNVGCPSDRVRQGTFGAVLMLQPELVRDCIAAMAEASGVPITVKCRLGVDDADTDDALLEFIETVAEAGCRRFYVHARKAILGGLSPAQNRAIPPLRPARARYVKRQLPHLEVILNGGISSLQEAVDHLRWADGVMIGRAAYHHPDLLSEIHTWLYPGEPVAPRADILARYRGYAAAQVADGRPLHAVTRHLLSTCKGLPGARRFRQTLSDARRLKSNDLAILDEALQHISAAAA